MNKFNIEWPIKEGNGTTIHLVGGDTVRIARGTQAPKTVGIFKTQVDGKLRLDKVSMNNFDHFFRKYQAYAEQCSIIDALDPNTLVVCHVKNDGTYYQTAKYWKEKATRDNFGAGDQYFLPKVLFKKTVAK